MTAWQAKQTEVQGSFELVDNVFEDLIQGVA